MIVYLFKKSKSVIKWGYIGGCVLGILYLCFVFRETQIANTQTIQIIKGNRVENTSNSQSQNNKIVEITETSSKADYAFVASSKGKYYYPTNCSKAQGLSLKNMLYFKDKMSAEVAGYVPHKAC